MKRIVLILFMCIPPLVSAQGNDKPAGAKAVALCNASVALCDIWSAQNNQAGLAFLEKTTAAAFYQNRHILKELSSSSLAFATPTKHATFGLALDHFGYSAYSRYRVGLSMARKFGKKIGAGIQFNYEGLSIRDYGNKGMVTLEAGLYAKATKDLHLAFHLYNPTRTRVAAFGDERLPTTVRLGLRYLLSENISLLAEADQSSQHPINVKAGMDYRVLKDFYLRGGFSLNPISGSFGFGYTGKNGALDMAASFNQYLGFSPCLSYAYAF